MISSTIAILIYSELLRQQVISLKSIFPDMDKLSNLDFQGDVFSNITDEVDEGIDEKVIEREREFDARIERLKNEIEEEKIDTEIYAEAGVIYDIPLKMAKDLRQSVEVDNEYSE